MKFRDVSECFRLLREMLLGRKHKLHNRFAPLIAPRTIPTPNLPRGPEYKYSNQFYYTRSAADSVKPPIVAPVAQGPPLNQDPTEAWRPGGMNPEYVCFSTLPTPGLPWWWDGHCYYECVLDAPPPCAPEPPPCPPPPPPAPCPPPPRQYTCDYPPPCPRAPDQGGPGSHM